VPPFVATIKLLRSITLLTEFAFILTEPTGVVASASVRHPSDSARSNKIVLNKLNLLLAVTEVDFEFRFSPQKAKIFQR
jgi:hypothetical protein